MLQFLSCAPVFLAIPPPPPLLLVALNLPRRLAAAADALLGMVHTDLLLLTFGRKNRSTSDWSKGYRTGYLYCEEKMMVGSLRSSRMLKSSITLLADSVVTGTGVMQTLGSNFRSKSTERQNELRRYFNRLGRSDEETVSAYLSRALELRNELHSICIALHSGDTARSCYEMTSTFS
jgi:hypothetical protein